MPRARERDLTLDADVVIVGTGAGGGTAAEILAAPGFASCCSRKGRCDSSRDFRMQESRGVSRALPGVGGAQDERQGHQHPAGPLRGRRHHGQLDELVPHAAGHARLLGARVRLDASSPTEAMTPWFARMEARLSIAPWTVAPNANNAALARGARKLGIGDDRDPPQREGLLEPGLLRHGLPDQRQAVDARHHDSGGARPRRDARHARARAATRPRGRPGRVARMLRDGCRGHRADGAQGHRARAHVRRGRGRDRHACAAVAQRRARSACARRQAHVPASVRRVGRADAGT